MPVASTRTRVLAAALLAMLALTSCTGPSASVGNALVGGGLPGQANLTGPGLLGHTYRFAFPTFSNTSKQALSIESVRVNHIPGGIKVLGYPVYSTIETGGLVIANTDGDPSTPDLAKMPNHAGTPINIPAGATSDLYAMISVKVVGHIEGRFSGCQVTYKTGTSEHTQTLWCDFGLTPTYA